MMAKILKSVIVAAVVMTFFGGTAMADRRGRDAHHSKDWVHSNAKRYHKAYHHDHYRKHVRAERRHNRHIRHDRYVSRHGHDRRHDHYVPKRSHYRKPRYQASSPHPLAPRVVFLGGLPVPVPPPPHEVLDFLTGR
ncbi:MAG: hypothetical protein P8X96_06255 [Desulfobacteraceae bacterium]